MRYLELIGFILILTGMFSNIGFAGIGLMPLGFIVFIIGRFQR